MPLGDWLGMKWKFRLLIPLKIRAERRKVKRWHLEILESSGEKNKTLARLEAGSPTGDLQGSDWCGAWVGDFYGGDWCGGWVGDLLGGDWCGGWVEGFTDLGLVSCQTSERENYWLMFQKTWKMSRRCAVRPSVAIYQLCCPQNLKANTILTTTDVVFGY